MAKLLDASVVKYQDSIKIGRSFQAKLQIP